MNGLREALPTLLPLAIEWAERISARAAQSGFPLSAPEEDLARRVGVRQPQEIRLSVGAELPFPEHPILQAAAIETGLLAPEMVGLTLGHAVFLRSGHVDERLLSHELRHVAQYEAAGSIARFMPVYLSQIIEFGYNAAPLEVDARTHEIDS